MNQNNKPASGGKNRGAAIRPYAPINAVVMMPSVWLASMLTLVKNLVNRRTLLKTPTTS
jgi:hypothetical protein